MNRQEFMAQLSRLLMDIDEKERREALDYYDSYFDDAGEEQEAMVIQELGSPGKVAAIIKEELKHDSHRHGEYTETGYEDARFREPKQTPQRMHAYQSQQRRGIGGWILIVIALIFAAPLVFGLAGGALGIAGGIFGILAGLIGMVVGFITGGVAFVIKGIAALFTSPATGLVQLGAGLLLTALGILCIVLLVLLSVKGLPRLFRACMNLIQRVLHHGKDGDFV